MTFSFRTPRPLTTYTPVSGRATPGFLQCYFVIQKRLFCGKVRTERPDGPIDIYLSNGPAVFLPAQYDVCGLVPATDLSSLKLAASRVNH